MCDLTCSDLIYQLSASKKSAEEEVDETLRLSCEREKKFEEVETSNSPKRNRKRKSYGEDFEEMVDEEKTTNEESDTVSVILTNCM